MTVDQCSRPPIGNVTHLVHHALVHSEVANIFKSHLYFRMSTSRSKLARVGVKPVYVKFSIRSFDADLKTIELNTQVD